MKLSDIDMTFKEYKLLYLQFVEANLKMYKKTGEKKWLNEVKELGDIYKKMKEKYEDN